MSVDHREVKGFRCIAKKYAEETKYGNVMWTDAGSGAKKDAAIKTIVGSPFF